MPVKTNEFKYYWDSRLGNNDLISRKLLVDAINNFCAANPEVTLREVSLAQRKSKGWLAAMTSVNRPATIRWSTYKRIIRILQDHVHHDYGKMKREELRTEVETFMEKHPNITMKEVSLHYGHGPGYISSAIHGNDYEYIRNETANHIMAMLIAYSKRA